MVNLNKYIITRTTTKQKVCNSEYIKLQLLKIKLTVKIKCKKRVNKYGTQNASQCHYYSMITNKKSISSFQFILFPM